MSNDSRGLLRQKVEFQDRQTEVPPKVQGARGWPAAPKKHSTPSVVELEAVSEVKEEDLQNSSASGKAFQTPGRLPQQPRLASTNIFLPARRRKQLDFCQNRWLSVVPPSWSHVDSQSNPSLARPFLGRLARRHIQGKEPAESLDLSNSQIDQKEEVPYLPAPLQRPKRIKISTGHPKEKEPTEPKLEGTSAPKATPPPAPKAPSAHAQIPQPAEGINPFGNCRPWSIVEDYLIIRYFCQSGRNWANNLFKDLHQARPLRKINDRKRFLVNLKSQELRAVGKAVEEGLPGFLLPVIKLSSFDSMEIVNVKSRIHGDVFTNQIQCLETLKSVAPFLNGPLTDSHVQTFLDSRDKKVSPHLPEHNPAPERSQSGSPSRIEGLIRPNLRSFDLSCPPILERNQNTKPPAKLPAPPATDQQPKTPNAPAISQLPKPDEQGVQGAKSPSDFEIATRILEALTNHQTQHFFDVLFENLREKRKGRPLLPAPIK